MRTLPFSDTALTDATAVLRSGGVVAHATETCYGFACDLRNPQAVERMFFLKKRAFEKPVSALMESVDQARRYVVWNDEADRLASMHLPGPLTIVLKRKEKELFPTPPALSSPEGEIRETVPTLGIRVSSHPHAQALVHAFGSPLSTTSANLSGRANPYSAEEVAAQFEHTDSRPDLILDSGRLPPNKPSTVIDLSGRTFRRHRSGGIEIS